MKFKLYIKSFFVISCLLFIYNNAFGQKSSCLTWCYLEFHETYKSENQKTDFDSLSIHTSQFDSIRILSRIIAFDCETAIGKKSIEILDKIKEKKRLALCGEWVFEWSGSNWGTGSVRSDSIKKTIIITDNNIQVIRNDTIQNKSSEILCLGLGYYKGTYLLIKIDNRLWKISLEKDFNNRYASIDTPKNLKLKNKFLYLRAFGAACGGTEMYYSKVE